MDYTDQIETELCDCERERTALRAEVAALKAGRDRLLQALEEIVDCAASPPTPRKGFRWIEAKARAALEVGDE